MSDLGTVLVIDDSELARLAITHALRLGGYTVLERDSPMGALRDAVRNGVTVVVIDVEMPGFRGDDLARLFRSNLGADVSLVLVSSLAENVLSALADEAGADAYVSKGRISTDLVNVIQGLQSPNR